jgi:hypothetical protein
VRSADFIVIDAPAGETIHDGTSASSAGGTLTASSQWAHVDIRKVTATDWVVVQKIGTWTAA